LLESFEKGQISPGIPLKFDNVVEEVNFISTVDLLNFASGYRPLLHHYCGRGAYETIIFGCISMHLSNIPITSNFMKTVDISKVAELFGIPTRKEKQLQPGLMIEEKTELYPLIQQICSVLNETGTILLNLGFPSLAHFIINVLNTSGKDEKTKKPLASKLIEALVLTFPAFNDVHEKDGQKIYVVKKAQLLAADLHKYLGSRDPTFQFSDDISTLTVFADNVLPAVLIELGIIAFKGEAGSKIQERIKREEEIKSEEKIDLELRAVAVVACEEIIQVAKQGGFKKEIVAMDLDYYLWKLGKEERFRKLPRHRTCDTIYY